MKVGGFTLVCPEVLASMKLDAWLRRMYLKAKFVRRRTIVIPLATLVLLNTLTYIFKPTWLIVMQPIPVIDLFVRGHYEIQKSFKPVRRPTEEYTPWNAQAFGDAETQVPRLDHPAKCPVMHWGHFHNETRVVRQRRGSVEYQKWAATKKKSPFLVQDSWQRSMFLGSEYTAEWDRVCLQHSTFDIASHKLPNGNRIEGNVKGYPAALVVRFPGHAEEGGLQVEKALLNPWHALQDNPTMWCAVHIAERYQFHGLPPWPIVAIIENNIPSMYLKWTKAILLSVFHKVYELAEVTNGQSFSTLSRWEYQIPNTRYHTWLVNDIKSPIYGQETSALYFGIPRDQFKLQRLMYIKRGFRSLVRIPEPTPSCMVLMLSRPPGKPRYVIDQHSGTFKGVLQDFCEAGLNIHSAELDDTQPLKEHFKLISQAKMLLGVHGAHLANMIWMDEGSAVVEVTVRYGHCCDPLPVENMGFHAPPCTGPCKPYDYVVYAMMAQQFGIRWFYYDPLYVEQLVCPLGADCSDMDNKDTSMVIIDGADLAKRVKGVLDLLGLCRRG